MKCKDCGKKIKHWLRVLLFHRVNIHYCIGCATKRFHDYREKVIFFGTNPYPFTLEGFYNTGWCPLYKNVTCMPRLDTESMNCPYKDGWRICYYYLIQDKDICTAGLTYDIYEGMKK